jgi:hypothetical protein
VGRVAWQLGNNVAMVSKRHKVTLAGNIWLWAYTRLRGSADGWQHADGKVLIHDKLSPQRRLEVEIHEALHCLYPDLSEESVTDGARDLRRLLWMLGYRRAD